MASRLTRRLAVALGIVYLGLGVAEVVTHLDDTVPALLFWALTLWGGAVLTVGGVVVQRTRARTGAALVVAGALAGAMPTAWTVLVPILAVTVVALVLRDLGRESGTLTGGGPGQQRREPGPTTSSGGQEGNASA